MIQFFLAEAVSMDDFHLFDHCALTRLSSP